MDKWNQVLKGVAAIVLSFVVGMVLGMVCGCCQNPDWAQDDGRPSVIKQINDFGTAPLAVIDAGTKAGMK